MLGYKRNPFELQKEHSLEKLQKGGICITADKNWHSLNINHNHYHLKHKFCAGKKKYKPQKTNYWKKKKKPLTFNYPLTITT